MGSLRAVITGTGSYLPPRVVKNTDLEKIMDTSDEWIRQRSGIEERRFVDQGMSASLLALKASESALESAGIKAADLDLIIVASLSPERYFPGTSSFLQHKLGASTTAAFDIRAQCTGFIYGLTLAQSLIESNAFKKILLVGVEIQSVALDMTTRGRDMAVLFGDGAGAVVLEAREGEHRGVIATAVHAQGEFADKLWMPYPTTNEVPVVSEAAIKEALMHPKMDGKLVFKNAVVRLPEVIGEVLQKSQMQLDNIDFFIFHQANLRINEFVADALKIPATKTQNNIQKYGNTSAASIPILLDECVRSGKVKQGDKVCLAAFGSGFTWGAAVVTM